MGLLSSLFGGGAYNEAIENLQQGRQRAVTYYQRKAYEDPLQDSATAATLKAARDMLLENNKRTAASAAVTAATDESVARQKAGTNAAIADMVSKAASEGSARRDAAMQNYISTAQQYDKAISDMKLQKEKEETGALSGLLSTGVSAAASIFGGPLAGAAAKSVI